METESRARHRLGGKHSDPIGMTSVPGRKPRGAHAARSFEPEVQTETVTETVTAIPPKPERAPKIGVVKAGHEFVGSSKILVGGSGSVGIATEYLRKDEDTGPTNVIPLKRNRNRGRRTKYQSAAIIATGGLLLVTGAHAMPGTMGMKRADATSTQPHDVVGNADGNSAEPQAITVPIDVIMNQPKVDVKTEAAPIPEPVVEPVQEVVAVAEAEPVPAAPRVIEKPAVAAVPQAPKPAVVAPPAASGRGSMIAAAALGQLGVSQDCTMLATNSMTRAGLKYFHGWPWEYAVLGTNVGVGNAQPGDLLLYAAYNGNPAHIAVYVGNGQAVHGGWDGWTTKLWSTMVGQPAYGPYAAIRV